MRQAIIEAEARRDLHELWHFIAQDKRSAADRLVGKIQTAIELLAERPGMGHTRADVQRTEYRFWCVKPYVIVYTYDDETLNVVRIIHGARDFRNALRDFA